MNSRHLCWTERCLPGSCAGCAGCDAKKMYMVVQKTQDAATAANFTRMDYRCTQESQTDELKTSEWTSWFYRRIQKHLNTKRTELPPPAIRQWARTTYMHMCSCDLHELLKDICALQAADRLTSPLTWHPSWQ